MIAGAAVSDSLQSEVNMPNWVLCAVVAVDKKAGKIYPIPSKVLGTFGDGMKFMG